MADGAFEVLLVEDNPAEAQLLAETLSLACEPCTVRHAESLEEARRILAERSFDAALLDLSLPDSRGLETLERMNALAPHVAILVLTGLDDEATGVEAIRKGAQDYLVKGHSDPSLLVRTIRYAIERKRAEEEVRSLNAELEERVQERTAVARQRADQLRRLASQLTRVEQQERRRLAKLLHDHLQQLLVAARLKLNSLNRRLHDESVRSIVQELDSLICESISASRAVTTDLSPPVLYDAGMKPGLDWLARHMQEKHGLKVDMAVEGNTDLPEETRVLLFNAVRELLLNVVKHAKTPKARVEMSSRPGEPVRITVTDDGVGFDPLADLSNEAYSSGFGLLSLRERLELLGGRLSVESTPRKGTRVEILGPAA